MRNASGTSFPNDWTIKEYDIIAPCGCIGVCPILEKDKLIFKNFFDCGRSSSECVFMSKTRVHTFRIDIPDDIQVWRWYEKQKSEIFSKSSVN